MLKNLTNLRREIRRMHNRMLLKKGLFAGIIGIGLLLSSVSISLAGEGDSAGGHGGMNMSGSTTPQVESKSTDTPNETTNSKPEADNSSMELGHEATPDMDPNMSGHGEPSGMDEQNSDGHDEASSSGGHGESSDGHGEESSAPEGVNWPVVWGFAGINALVVVIAGILKFMNNNKSSTVRE